MSNGGDLIIGLSRVPAKHIRLKPGGSSTLPSSAVLRTIQIDDIYKGYLELLDEFAGCPTLLENREAAIDILKTIPYNQIVVVADINNKIVGTATITIEKKVYLAGKSVGHISEVAVLNRYQSIGIGSALITYLEEIAESNDCARLALSCNDLNVRYYNRFGFEKTSNHMRKMIYNAS